MSNHSSRITAGGGRFPDSATLSVFFLDDFGGQFLPLLDEFHRDRVDAVASVLGRHSFSLEYVAKVSLAVAANNFDSIAIFIDPTDHGTLDLVIKTWPSTMAFKFVLSLVKLGVALAANVGAGVFGHRITTRASWFGPLIQNHVCLALIQLVVVVENDLLCLLLINGHLGLAPGVSCGRVIA